MKFSCYKFQGDGRKFGSITKDIAIHAKDKVPTFMDLVGAERDKES